LGSNKPDSEETIATMVDDGIQEAAVIPDTQHLVSVLEAKGVRVVTESDWYTIKAAEEAAGQVLNKPREKKITRADLLDCLSS
jgi:nicotinamidase-related amidase